MNHIACKICIFTLLCIAFIQAQAIELTPQEALKNVKLHFNEKLVDFYLSYNSVADSLIIFVDAEPTMNWGHVCYTFTYAKEVSSDNISELSPSIKKYNYPPKQLKLQPLDVTVNTPMGNHPAPIVYDNPMPMNMLRSPGLGHSAAAKTQAIIISGGIDDDRNYPRYWNDCSFLYQTLTKRYYIPKDNIHCYIADGGIQAGSLLVYTGDGIEPVPNDLDCDGETDIIYEAKYNLIKNAFHNLDITTHPLDHVFVYVMDHGDVDTLRNESFICLWGEDERLYASEFREMIKPLTDKNVFVNIIMGQCHSGGFINLLYDLQGLTIATACKTEEKSGAFIDLTKPLGQCCKYDEFVYQWTSAINGANAYGEGVNADYNEDGHVTMEEAFIYALNHDRLNTETPQYYSNPSFLGQYISFSRLPHSTNYDELFSNKNDNLYSFTLQSNTLTIHKDETCNRNCVVSIYAMLPNSSLLFSYQFEGKDSELVVDLTNYSAGIYVATINDDTGNSTNYKFNKF